MVADLHEHDGLTGSARLPTSPDTILECAVLPVLMFAAQVTMEWGCTTVRPTPPERERLRFISVPPRDPAAVTDVGLSDGIETAQVYTEFRQSLGGERRRAPLRLAPMCGPSHQ